MKTKTKKRTTESASKTKKPSKKAKVGLFGGSFNPFHLGHLNSLLAVQKEYGLKEIRIIPSFQTPGKPLIESPSAEQRLDMINLSIEEYKFLKADEREIDRGGISYTIDTLNEILSEDPDKQYFLILGADLIASFEKWKDFTKILESVDLIVTSRPGNLLPFKKDDLPLALQPFVQEMTRQKVKLTTGKSIEYFQLEDKEISGTEIRKCVRAGLRVDRYLSLTVERYIRENQLYRPSATNQLDFKEITAFVGGVLFDKKGFNVQGFDLNRCQAPSEYAIIASGTSTRHVGSLGESVVSEVKKKFGLNPISVEGLHEGRWALVDFGGLIVHVFYDFVRQEYKLEDLWKEKIDLKLRDSSTPTSINF